GAAAQFQQRHRHDGGDEDDRAAPDVALQPGPACLGSPPPPAESQPALAGPAESVRRPRLAALRRRLRPALALLLGPVGPDRHACPGWVLFLLRRVGPGVPRVAARWFRLTAPGGRGRSARAGGWGSLLSHGASGERG